MKYECTIHTFTAHMAVVATGIRFGMNRSSCILLNQASLKRHEYDISLQASINTIYPVLGLIFKFFYVT